MLTLYVVYDRPRDFPEFVVVRAQVAVRDGTVAVDNVVSLFDSVAAARADLAGRGLTSLARHPDDDPAIVEVWL